MFSDEFDLNDLDSENGFAIEGIDDNDAFFLVVDGAPPSFALSGYIVSDAGDINNDGFDDLLVGAPGAAGEDNDEPLTGEVYVVFGSADFDDLGTDNALDLDDLDGDNGFVINGIDAASGDGIVFGNGTGTGLSAAGDLDGDGFDDILIGAPGVETGVGEAYVIFGNDSFSASLDLEDLDGDNGFVLEGFADFGGAGAALTTAGDLNGDGIDDIAIAALSAENDDGDLAAGQVYVVFGATGDTEENFGTTFDLEDLDGNNGFILNGEEEGDGLGTSISGAGDVNGDGIDDLIVGAPLADPPNDENGGISYVIFGQANGGFDENFDLDDLDGSNGFAIEGIDDNDNLGLIASTGDFNGDGTVDILVGGAATTDDDTTGGELYVIFGDPQLGSSGTFDPDDLDGDNGFIITNLIEQGETFFDSANFAGDINDDGFDDLLIGLPNADPSGDTDAGQVFVLFGGTDITNGDDTFDLEDFDAGDDGFFVDGLDSGDGLGLSVSTAGDLNNDGAADIILAAPGGDPNGNTENGGESFVIFGISTNADPIATDDTAATFSSAAITIDVLANDSDPDDDSLNVSLLPALDDAVGLATLNADNTITYDPNGQFDTLAPGATATDSFAYSLDDGQGGSATAAVTVTITGAVDAEAIAPSVTATVEAAASTFASSIGTSFQAALASPAYAELALSATGAEVFASLNAAIAASPTPDVLATEFASALGL